MAYGNPQHLYVVESSDGIIKAGITSRTAARVNEHSRRARIVNSFTSCPISGIEAERELIARLARIGVLLRGREWFVGIRFSLAAQIAQQVARQFANANPVSKAHLLRTGRLKLCFNDSEIATLDAYCRLVGKSRAAASRDLALSGIARLAHAANSSARL